jgi:hypothetical protein
MKHHLLCIHLLLLLYAFRVDAFVDALASWLTAGSSKRSSSSSAATASNPLSPAGTPPPPPAIELKTVRKYINASYTRQPMLDHYAWKDIDPARDVINDVAVFLLGTFSGAAQFGEKKPALHGADNFFERVVAARVTWARYVRHFFMVTGAAPAESRVLPSAHCDDVTAAYATNAAGGSDKGKERSDARPQEVHVCAGVAVLHLPRCEGTSWGR